MKDLEKSNHFAFLSLVCAAYVAQDLFNIKLNRMSKFALEDKIDELITNFFKETEYEK